MRKHGPFPRAARPGGCESNGTAARRSGRSAAATERQRRRERRSSPQEGRPAAPPFPRQRRKCEDAHLFEVRTPLTEGARAPKRRNKTSESGWYCRSRTEKNRRRLERPPLAHQFAPHQTKNAPRKPHRIDRWKSGGCRFGERCNFAHVQDKLRPLPRRGNGGEGEGGLPILAAKRSLVRRFFFPTPSVTWPSCIVSMLAKSSRLSAFEHMHLSGETEKRMSEGIVEGSATIWHGANVSFFRLEEKRSPRGGGGRERTKIHLSWFVCPSTRQRPREAFAAPRPLRRRVVQRDPDLHGAFGRDSSPQSVAMRVLSG